MGPHGKISMVSISSPPILDGKLNMGGEKPINVGWEEPDVGGEGL